MKNRYAMHAGARAGWLMNNPLGLQIPMAPDDGTGADDAAAKAAAEAKAAEEAAAAAAKAKADEEAAAEAKAAEEAAKKAKEEGISDREAELLRDLMKNKDARKAAEEVAAEAAKKLAQFDGIDPDEARRLKQEKIDAEKAAAEAAGDFEKVKKMMAEEHTKALEAEKAAAKKANEDLSAANRRINDLTIGSAFSDSSFIKDELLLTPAKTRQVYESHFEVEGNVVVGYNKPRSDASRAKLVNASGDPLSFDEAMKRIIDADPDRDKMLRSKMAKGAKSGADAGDSKKSDKSDEGGSGISRIRAGLQKASQSQ